MTNAISSVELGALIKADIVLVFFISSVAQCLDFSRLC